MYPILLNAKNEGYNFQEFAARFMQICEEHRSHGRALVFAFVLYDLENAHIAKVLKDEDYWQSLDTISGNFLTVFSIHRKPIKRGRNLLNNDNVLYHMTTVRDYHNPSETSNSLIQKYFGAIGIKYPAVLFFQVRGEEVLDYTLIELDEENIEPAFHELKKYIKTAVDTLKMITEENRGNSKEIFDLVKDAVRAERTIKVTSRRVRKVTSIGELVSAIVGLKG